MKYPEKFYITVDKKLSKTNKVKHLDWLKRNLLFRPIGLSRKNNDCRSGVDYQITGANDYSDSLEFELTRVDVKNYE